MKIHENQKEVTGDKNTHPRYFQKILTYCFHIHQNSARRPTPWRWTELIRPEQRLCWGCLSCL